MHDFLLCYAMTEAGVTSYPMEEWQYGVPPLHRPALTLFSKNRLQYQTCSL